MKTAEMPTEPGGRRNGSEMGDLKHAFTALGLLGWCAVTLVVVICGCTSVSYTVGPGLRPIPESELTNRLVLKWFSILPPQDTNWVVSHRGTNAILFRKQLDSPTHSLVALVRAAPPAKPFDSPETFLMNLKQGLLQESAGPRYELLESSMQLDPRFGPYCVKYLAREIDNRAPGPGGRTTQIQVTQGYNFVHPYSTNMTIDITWSEKGKPEERAPGTEPIREKFFDGLQLNQTN